LLKLREPFSSGEALVAATKAFELPLLRPRPIAEAISSAGGVRWEGITEELMIRTHPGLFVAGEMIDWEAPTGGYLMQGCFASGTKAARSAVEFLKGRQKN
jgi:predicted flavoprotein YhiN